MGGCHVICLFSNYIRINAYYGVGIQFVNITLPAIISNPGDYECELPLDNFICA